LLTNNGLLLGESSLVNNIVFELVRVRVLLLLAFVAVLALTTFVADRTGGCLILLGLGLGNLSTYKYCDSKIIIAMNEYTCVMAQYLAIRFFFGGLLGGLGFDLQTTCLFRRIRLAGISGLITHNTIKIRISIL
jgi:hypothetical protein